MATRRTARTTHAAAANPSDAGAVLGGVVSRMGDIMGPGAVYSLVHYGAIHEGERLGALLEARSVEAGVRQVADLLQVQARLTASPGAHIRVHVAAADHLHLEDRGVQALLAGLLEGVLGVVLRKKCSLARDPYPTRDGGLEFDLSG